MVNLDGSWNLDLFRVWVFEDVISRITSIPPPHPDFSSDRVIWVRLESRVFSIRGIGHNNSCTLCGHDFEDLAHVLRNYPSAKDVWMLVIPDQLKQRFFSTSFQDWLILNLCFHERLQVTDVVKVSSCWARQYESHFGGHKNNNSTNNSDDIWVYLSTDGAVVRDSGHAATGEVARDHDGNWIGYKRIIIMTDNLEVAQNLADLDLEDSEITVLRRTQHIMQSEGEWKIKHILRNQNLVANRLAKLSLS
ncbi:hypothetical protein Goarm_018774 [Gossypium armourianum]|uniref:RNase H type-1 domain-containing protein n=1 Tax=Gossypium armourianum TaxID=34283 RepID=A0A7J9IIL4_9ROSI|nr:hypothetical protein [Gossypium armourianum]